MSFPNDGAGRLGHDQREGSTADNHCRGGRGPRSDGSRARELRAVLREHERPDSGAGHLDAMTLADAFVRAPIAADIPFHDDEHPRVHPARTAALLFSAISCPTTMAGPATNLADDLWHVRRGKEAARRAHHAAHRLALVEAAIDGVGDFLRHSTTLREVKPARRRLGVADGSRDSGLGEGGKQAKDCGEKELHDWWS